jgi:hypothetical protein
MSQAVRVQHSSDVQMSLVQVVVSGVAVKKFTLPASEQLNAPPGWFAHVTGMQHSSAVQGSPRQVVSLGFKARMFALPAQSNGPAAPFDPAAHVTVVQHSSAVHGSPTQLMSSGAAATVLSPAEQSKSAVQTTTVQHSSDVQGSAAHPKASGAGLRSFGSAEQSNASQVTISHVAVVDDRVPSPAPLHSGCVSSTSLNPALHVRSHDPPAASVPPLTVHSAAPQSPFSGAVTAVNSHGCLVQQSEAVQPVVASAQVTEAGSAASALASAEQSKALPSVPSGLPFSPSHLGKRSATLAAIWSRAASESSPSGRHPMHRKQLIKVGGSAHSGSVYGSGSSRKSNCARASPASASSSSSPATLMR